MTPTDDLLKREHDMITPELRAIYNKRNPTEDDLIAMAMSEAERALLSLPPHCHPTAGGLQHNEDHANACAHRCWSFLGQVSTLRTMRAAALESDRALLRRIVEAHHNGTGIAALIDEAPCAGGRRQMTLADCTLCPNKEDPRCGIRVDGVRYPLCDGCAPEPGDEMGFRGIASACLERAKSRQSCPKSEPAPPPSSPKSGHSDAPEAYAISERDNAPETAWLRYDREFGWEHVADAQDTAACVSYTRTDVAEAKVAELENELWAAKLANDSVVAGDIETTAEELSAARAEGYRAGIEAAASLAYREGAWLVAGRIRMLAEKGRGQ